jgi:hypothetical protein
MMQNVPKATEMSRGHCQFSNAGRAQVGELSAKKEPSLAIVRLTPNAKESSLPLNHFAIAVVTETMSDSAPRPKMSRPVAITAREPLTTVTTAPTKHRTPNSSVAFLTPIRSMMIPPMSTIKMFGKL